MGPEDLTDMMVYVMQAPGLDPSAKASGSQYKHWGGQTDLADAEVGKLLQAAEEALPVLLAFGERVQGAAKGKKKSKPESKKKEAGVVKVAGGAVFLGALVAVRARQEVERRDREKASYEDWKQDYEDRKAEAKKRREWTPEASPKQSLEHLSATVYHKGGKKGRVFHLSQEKGQDKAEWKKASEKWLEDHRYEDYKWASKLMGTKPLGREEWQKAMAESDRKARSSWHQVSVEKSVEGYKTFRENPVWWELPRVVSEVVAEHGDNADIKALVAQKQKQDVGAWRKKSEQWREEYLKPDIDRESAIRFKELVEEEKTSAGLFEKAVGYFAPEWAKGKAESRAKSRSERGESTSKRTFEDYKAEHGGEAKLTKDEWEARFKG